MDGIPSCFDLQPSPDQIEQTLVTFDKRIVTSGYTIKVDNHEWELRDKSGRQKFIKPKTSISVITMMNEEKFVLYNNILYSLYLFEPRQKTSKAVDFNYKPIKIKTKYIPSYDHPWRRSHDNFFKKNLSSVGSS